MRSADAGMDPLTAHLDRGWGLLTDMDYAGARVSAQEVLKRVPDHAEGLTLLGMAELGSGDREAALEAFDAAREQDPEYLAPVFYSAEALAVMPDEVETALARIEEAYQLAEPRSPEYVDITLLHVDLLRGQGEDREARRCLMRLDPEHLDEVDQRIQVGRTAAELDAASYATQVLTPFAELPTPPPDALYALGRVAELRDEIGEALELFLRTREADEAALPQRRLPTGRELEALCREAIRRLPKELRAVVADVQIRVRDLPAEELVADGLDPRLPLLVTGPPLPAENGAGLRAFHVFLYRANLHLDPTADPQQRLDDLTDTLAVSLERFVEAP